MIHGRTVQHIDSGTCADVSEARFEASVEARNESVPKSEATLGGDRHTADVHVPPEHRVSSDLPTRIHMFGWGLQGHGGIHVFA